MDYSRIETMQGMVADLEVMHNFRSYLGKLVFDLTDKMNDAIDALEKIEELGYSDDTYIDYRDKFVDEVDFINEMNVVLGNSDKHYEKLAVFVEEHNKHIMKNNKVRI